jgi:hypothetical protein
MPAPYHSLHRKLENVIKQLLSLDEDLGVHLYSYMEVVALGESVEEPFVGVRCQHSTSTTPEVQLTLGSGSRVISVELRIRSHALHITDGKDPLKVVQAYRDYHDQIVGKVVDRFMRDDLIVALNQLCQVEGGIEVEQVDQFEMNDNPEDRSGVTEVTFPITCHPKEWGV